MHSFLNETWRNDKNAKRVQKMYVEEKFQRKDEYGSRTHPEREVLNDDKIKKNNNNSTH